MSKLRTEKNKDAAAYRAGVLEKVLRSPADLTRVVDVPADITPALATSRPELLMMAKPRAMSAEEVGRLYHLIGVLIETNAALREHAVETSKMARQLWTQAVGVETSLFRLEAFAAFKDADDLAAGEAPSEDE